jgi:hypothetical protein
MEAKLIPFFAGASGPEPRIPVLVRTDEREVFFGGLLNPTLQRTRLHRDFAVPLRVTDGQPISLQPCTVNKDDWSVEEPFGKAADVVPELVEHDGHAKLELALDFLEPYLVVIDAPRYIGFALAA